MKAWDSQTHFLTKTDRFFYIYIFVNDLLSASASEDSLAASIGFLKIFIDPKRIEFKKNLTGSVDGAQFDL